MVLGRTQAYTCLFTMEDESAERRKRARPQASPAASTFVLRVADKFFGLNSLLLVKGRIDHFAGRYPDALHGVAFG